MKPLALSDNVQEKLNALLKKYKRCFATNNFELENVDIEMEIRLTNNEPVCYRPYRLSFHERELVRKIVDELLRNGIIEPSKSSYASPILLVHKKSGEPRVWLLTFAN